MSLAELVPYLDHCYLFIVDKTLSVPSSSNAFNGLCIAKPSRAHNLLFKRQTNLSTRAATLNCGLDWRIDDDDDDDDKVKQGGANRGSE